MTMQVSPKPCWFKRFCWLGFIWFGSVLTLGVVAFVFRLLMKAAGLTMS